jgi:hypothetical protein
MLSTSCPISGLLKQGRAIYRLVREHVIRHDQGLLVFKGGASFGMSSEEQQKNRQIDRRNSLLLEI